MPSYNIPTPFLASNFSPWFITGLSDSDGCFNINIHKNSNYKLGYGIKLRFFIRIHKQDAQLLHIVKLFFNCGSVSRTCGASE